MKSTIFLAFLFKIILGSPDAVAASEEPCVAAPDAGSAKALVCSNQRRYTFLEIVAGNLGTPGSLSFSAQTETGAESYRLTRPEIKATDIIYRDAEVEFQRTDLSSSPPKLGYVLIRGNSGTCIAAKSGTARSCFKILQEGYNGDNVRLPEVAPPDYGLLPFRFEFRHPTGRNGCQLATPREIAEIAQVEVRKSLIAETKFSGIEINVSKVMREIGRMKMKGYQAVYVSTPEKQTVDFYFIPTKLKFEQPIQTNAAGAFDGPLRFVEGAFASNENMSAADHLLCITGGAK